jgi:hypothetical protein
MSTPLSLTVQITIPENENFSASDYTRAVVRALRDAAGIIEDGAYPDNFRLDSWELGEPVGHVTLNSTPPGY